MSDAPSPRSCLNCGAPLAGKFCAACGQRDVPPYPTIREMVGDAWEDLSGWDGRFASTIVLLFTGPGLLTLASLEGQRNRYIKPLRLYLVASIAYFLVAASTPNIGTQPRATVPGEQEVRIDLLNPDDGGLTPEQMAQARRNIEDAPRWIKPLFETVLQDPAGFRRRMFEAMPRVVFALVPAFAALLAIFYRRRRFMQHLFFSLHMHTVVFVTMAAADLTKFTRLIPLVVAAQVLAWAFVAGYGAKALKRVYQNGWGATMAKAVGLLALYVPLWTFAMVCLLVWTVYWS